MKPSMKYYNRLSLLAVVILIILIAIQIHWIQSTLKVQREAHAQKLLNHAPLIALEINKIDHNSFHGDDLNFDSLLIRNIKNVFSTYISSQNLSETLQFGLFQNIENGIELFSDTKFKNELSSTEAKSCITCITSFSIAKSLDRNPRENDQEYFQRVTENSTFQYFSPILDESNINDKTLWLSLYDPDQSRDVIITLIPTLLISIFLLLILIALIYFLLNSIAQHKEESKLKDDFFNNMTHEFKTPLSSIRLASKVLRKSKNTDKNETYHKLIERESIELEKQVDRLLNLSFLENNKAFLNFDKLNIHNILKDVKHRLQSIIIEKNASLNLDLDQEAPVFTGDQLHLKNAFINLIENSLKYAGDEPNIEIMTRTSSDRLDIFFSDDGPGIPAQHHSKIFDRFYRAIDKNEYKGQGFGIGLSYVQSVIENHKGSISLDPNYRKGCRFKISLPL